MKVTIAHVDTCLPDYWSGHHLPHVMIPAYPQSFANVRRAIRDELRQGAVMGSDDDARLLSSDMVRPCEESRADMLTRAVYAAINRDIRPRIKGDRLAFRDVEVSDDCGESVYAYFVIIVHPSDKFYLRMGDDYLENAKPYASKTAAINAFTDTARELWRYGQKISASIHIAESMNDIAEYPDYILETGPRGGIRIESV